MSIEEEIESLKKLENVYLRERDTAENSHKTINAYHAWYNKAYVLFRKFFSVDDADILDFKNIDNSGNGYVLHWNYNSIHSAYCVLMDRLKESQLGKTETMGKKSVFIVHGHNDTMKSEVARLVEKQKYEAIILHERPDEGDTIIQKLEKIAPRSCYGVVIYTACDKGRACESKVLNARARQNVVFEHGYLNGVLGRQNVCCLYEEGVELPSDLNGLLYVPIDKGGAWKFHLLKNMEAAGLVIDMKSVTI